MPEVELQESSKKVHYIQVDEIVIEDRQRGDLHEQSIGDLADSLERFMMHPIVVRWNDDLRVQLVAGERRLTATKRLATLGRAIKYAGEQLDPGFIPAHFVEDLSHDELQLAELEENIRREDITWQEKARAMSKLHHLLVKEHHQQEGSSPDSLAGLLQSSPEDPIKKPWTPRDTAHYVTHNPKADATKLVTNKVIIAKHLDDPAVARAKSEREALAIIKRKQARELSEYLAEIEGIVDDEDFVFENCSFAEGLERFVPEKSIDVLLTDPPYGIKAENFGGGHSLLTHEYQDDAEHAIDTTAQMLQLAAPCLKEDAHVYLFCDIEHFLALRGLCQDLGWRTWRTPLIWVKTVHGLPPDPDYGPARAYEMVLYAIAGDRKTMQHSRDTLTYGPAPNKIHPAQKPVPLLADLLKRSAHTGDTVLDPFAGSGSTILAAKELNLKAYAFEIDAGIYADAKVRIATTDEDTDNDR